MRLGGCVVGNYKNPEEWIKLVKEIGYYSTVSPINYDDSTEIKREYMKLAKQHNVLIAEVGVWRNTIAPDDIERKSALEYAKNQLALADEISANCCVNIVGSTGERWDGYYKENYSADTYTLIVDSVRDIIDSVNPKNTFYSIEPMPWMIPDGVEEYLQLIKDIDRKTFGVHLDYVNMINSPKRYLFANEFITECFTKLGGHIKSCHAKDSLMGSKFTSMIEEVAPGKGTLDYAHILKHVQAISNNTPLIIEHLDTTVEYKNAFDYIKNIAAANNINICGE